MGESTTGGDFTTGGESTTGWELTTGGDFTTGGDSTTVWESTTGVDSTTGEESTTGQSTTASDSTTLPPSQCVDEGCSSEHDGWGECVDFSKDVDWRKLTTEFDLSAGQVAGKCGNARVAAEECCKCMKAKSTTQPQLQPRRQPPPSHGTTIKTGEGSKQTHIKGKENDKDKVNYLHFHKLWSQA